MVLHSKKKKKSGGYVKPEVDEKDYVSAWEGFVEILSKTQASHLSLLLKNKGRVADFPSDNEMEKDKDLSEQKKLNEKK